MNEASGPAGEREAMVREQIAARGVKAPAVLAALREVPREAFVPEHLRGQAYEDSPLPIGIGQTISQPYIVALMLEAAALKPGDRVLDVGAGSGYACAVASRIVSRVIAIERLRQLADAAAERLHRLGYDNVEVHCGDGSAGWPDAAPYDAILVAASGPRLPRALLDQLAPGGRLVMPVGAGGAIQQLVKVTRIGGGRFREEDLGGVAFVPLIGAQAWQPPGSEREA